MSPSVLYVLCYFILFHRFRIRNILILINSRLILISNKMFVFLLLYILYCVCVCVCIYNFSSAASPPSHRLDPPLRSLQLRAHKIPIHLTDLCCCCNDNRTRSISRRQTNDDRTSETDQIEFTNGLILFELRWPMQHNATGQPICKDKYNIFIILF